MFTGIISDVGTVTAVEQRGDLRVTVATAYDMSSVAIGASIACSGVCLTVIDKGAGWFAADVSAETESCSAQGQWTAGKQLNLERAMRLGDELGGHIVTGHIDGVGEVRAVDEVGGSRRVTIAVGSELAPYLAAKGSVTADGVSLTVNTVEDVASGSCLIGLNIIPHTWTVTALQNWHTGVAVNIEIDVLSRYLSRMQDVVRHRAVIG